MSQADFIMPIASVTGKIDKDSNGYFYIRNGRKYYRLRKEDYQKNQTPKQKWRSQAFAYAQKQMTKLSPEEKQALELQWRKAKGVTPFGTTASTPDGWRRSNLIYEWQQANPFDSWTE